MPASIARPASCEPAGPLAPTGFAEPLLDAEKLVVYRVALEFQALAATLVPCRGHADLRDQLDRASASILLNLAEGTGRFSPADKARFTA